MKKQWECRDGGCRACGEKAEAKPRISDEAQYSRLGNHNSSDQNSKKHLLKAYFIPGNSVSTYMYYLPSSSHKPMLLPP